ncbi:DUF6192 family protein [Streptomyces sp. NPDC048252]|uniref:DUF6192 family protein n=1 Tax=Streptomyces sp. NPDC048252 TaxID=3154612 RepID=UPI0034218C81
MADEEERFEAILTPPAGKSRWSPDEANRRAGRQASISPAKVSTRMPSVAAETTDNWPV